LNKLVSDLRQQYMLKLISGDNDAEREKVASIFGNTVDLYFNQKPEEKMSYVANLQANGATVMMIGDGLNDAGALKQSDLGIAVSDDTNNFSPACDAIIDGEAFARLPDLISVAKAGKKVIIGVFIFSLTYNIVGLFFAVKGVLSPVVAAILMPASTISIVVLVTVSMGIIARFKKL
jgi:Cu+-exporting ATPase